MDRVRRMSSRNPSGGTSAAPRVPMPPALETAATSAGVATKPIPAPMNGTSSPYASVKRVRNIFYPFLQLNECEEQRSSLSRTSHNSKDPTQLTYHVLPGSSVKRKCHESVMGSYHAKIRRGHW